MWYKQSTSMGMYTDSIAKNIAKLFLQKVKRSISIFKTDSFYNIVYNADIKDAIRIMNVPNQIKENLYIFFGKLSNIYISINKTTDSKSKRISVNKRFFQTYKDFANESDIFIDFTSNADNYIDLKQDLQLLYEKTVYTLRHELEHYLQIPKERMKDIKNFDNKFEQWLKDHINFLEEKYVSKDEDFFAYMMNNKEIEAYVASTYQQARIIGKSFSFVLRENIINPSYTILLKRYKHELHAEEIAKNESEQIFHKYMDYARQRYGKEIK